MKALPSVRVGSNLPLENAGSLDLIIIRHSFADSAADSGLAR
jgi:hypothetical protein